MMKDDRTEAQKLTHVFAVVARDKFMSGWGEARGGHSRCAWACPSLHLAEQLQGWVADRSEMRNVSVVDLRTYRVPSRTAHFHIYVAEADHPGMPLGVRESAGKGAA